MKRVKLKKMENNNFIKPWKVWKDVPNYKYKGRYFETSKDYKADMIKRGEIRHIRASHINRKLSKHEEKTIIPFVKKHLYFEKDAYCDNQILYPYYEEFCRENNLIPLRAQVFGTCIKVYVFLQENIHGVLFARKDVYQNDNVVGYYNLGIRM